MHKFIEAAGLLLLFLCAGSLWMLLERCLPDGWPRSVSIVLLGGVFAGVFIWLLVSRLRKLFAGLSPLARQLPLALPDLALLIGAFEVANDVCKARLRSRIASSATGGTWTR